MTVDKLLIKKFDTSQFKQRNVTMTPNGAMFKTDKKGISTRDYGEYVQ